jgi:hypothetical protein
MFTDNKSTQGNLKNRDGANPPEKKLRRNVLRITCLPNGKISTSQRQVQG